MRHLRRNLSIASLGLGLFATARSQPVVAQPLWSRTDTGIGSLVSQNGRIAQPGGALDSGWLRILEPDGRIRWSVGMKVPSKAYYRIPSVSAMAETPDGGWIVGFDTSATRTTGSVLYRFDSLGRQVGSPMSMRYDSSLSLSVVAMGSETWVAANVVHDQPTSLLRFFSSGILRDSLRLALPGEFLSLNALGRQAMAHYEIVDGKSSKEFVYLLGSPTEDPSAATTILDQDSLDCKGYSNFVKIRPTSGGLQSFSLVTDSGMIDYPTARFPRVRVTTWIAEGDSLHRSADATVDLAYTTSGRYLSNGNLRIFGSHQIPATTRFEPAIIDIGTQGTTVRANTIHPSATAKTDIGSAFGRFFADGSGFAGVKDLDGSYALSLFDADGDSLRTISVVPRGSITTWSAQPDGNILTLRHSESGESITLETWSVPDATSILGRQPTCKSLRASGTYLILDLDQPTRHARLDVVDLQGRILSSREIGSLEAGRHYLTPDGTGTRIVRLQLDDTRLIAKATLP